MHPDTLLMLLENFIPYPDVYLLIYRHTDTASDFSLNKSMQTTRFNPMEP